MLPVYLKTLYLRFFECAFVKANPGTLKILKDIPGKYFPAGILIVLHALFTVQKLAIVNKYPVLVGSKLVKRLCKVVTTHSMYMNQSCI